MRPHAEQEDMKRLLQCLEECSKKLLEDLRSIKEKGELWINEKETSTFQEIKKTITEETMKILQRNISYTRIQLAKFADTASLTENNITDEGIVKALDISSIPKGKRKLLESEKDEENSSEVKKKRVLETEKAFDKKSANVEKVRTIGLQRTSDHLLVLRNQCETLSQEIKDIKEKEAKIQIDVNKKIEHMQEVQQGFKKTLDDLSKRLSVVETKPEHFQQTIYNRNKETSKLECSEQATGITGIKCIEDSQLIIGNHEQQLSPLGEADLYTHLERCTKNAGHKNFIPVSEFSLEHLPQGHQNNDTLELIKAAADLTVRVSVTKTSKDRPEFWPNTKVPYFLYHMRESGCLRTGSGMVVKISKGMGYNNWKVTVQTSASVVFDQSEAMRATIRLFYDAKNSPEVVLKSSYCFNKDVNEDTCYFEFETFDEKLVKNLQALLSRYDTLYQKVIKTSNNDDFMFIVSHPHGCSKQISVGQRLVRLTSKPGSDKITYSTSTCPGSSGAIVHCVGHINMNHTGCLSSGQNYCSYRGSFN